MPKKPKPPRLRSLPRDSGDLRLTLAQLAEKIAAEQEEREKERDT